MIRSMTAFARACGEQAGAALTWELRSVNHRYLETFVRLPEELRGLEPVVRERVTARLGRGKLECMLRVNWSASQAAAIQLDYSRLKALLYVCREIETRTMEATSPGVMELLRWPGVVCEPEPDTGAVQEQALVLLEQALDELTATREREGEQINALLTARLDAIAGQISRVRQCLPEIQQKVRSKLQARLAELATRADNDRLEQELVLLAQKMDVDEELQRLEGHVAETRRVLVRDEPVGRRLDFLMQEFNREANTLGSKSADSETTAISVELKVLIEQMREQVQNVE
jgi:uncharacterized protein (TIGR00255 family)